MKRPEGFDAQPLPKQPRRAPAPPPAARPTRSRPAAPSPGERTPASAGRERAPVAAVRSAKRARRREERREVKRFTQRSRRRRIAWATSLGVVVVLALLVMTAVFSPLLALRHIRIDGTSRLSSETLEKAIDGQLGTPLALLDEGRIRTELSHFSLIRSYVTELQPPNTLIIHVVERTPVGVVVSENAFDLVDPAGVVIDSTAKRPDGVPLIDLGDGTITGPGFASMAQVLLALPTPLLAQVDTISAQTHDDVTLTLRGSNQRVLWGSADQSDLKARLLNALVAKYGASGPGTYTVSAPQFGVFHADS